MIDLEWLEEQLRLARNDELNRSYYISIMYNAVREERLSK